MYMYIYIYCTAHNKGSKGHMHMEGESLWMTHEACDFQAHQPIHVHVSMLYMYIHIYTCSMLYMYIHIYTCTRIYTVPVAEC